MKFLKGTGVAMVTPFNHKNEVDYDSIPKIIDYLINGNSSEGGVDYIVVLGTTAESVNLSYEEKIKILKIIVKHNDKRLPLVIGIGSNSTFDVLSFLEKEKSFININFSALLSVCPYYNKPSQSGIYLHYKKIAETSKIPVILYNVPSRTGVGIELNTILNLSKIDNIVGIKEASGNLSHALELISKLPQNFHFISGDDELALSIVQAGGSGVISVIAGAFPTYIKQMIDFGFIGNLKKANEIQFKLLPLIKLIFREGNPSGIKGLLSNPLINLCENNLRLPLTSVSDKLKNEIDFELKKIF